MRRRILATLAAMAATLAVPALSAAETVGPTRLIITPAHPGTRTNVVVRFVQPSLSRLVPGQRTSETLQITGAARPGCAIGGYVNLPASAAGSMMRETLRPARMTGRHWCAGVHRVALTVASYSTCPVGPGRMICPQYVVAPLTVATASFRVTAR